VVCERCSVFCFTSFHDHDDATEHFSTCAGLDREGEGRELTAAPPLAVVSATVPAVGAAIGFPGIGPGAPEPSDVKPVFMGVALVMFITLVTFITSVSFATIVTFVTFVSFVTIVVCIVSVEVVMASFVVEAIVIDTENDPPRLASSPGLSLVPMTSPERTLPSVAEFLTGFVLAAPIIRGSGRFWKAVEKSLTSMALIQGCFNI